MSMLWCIISALFSSTIANEPASSHIIEERDLSDIADCTTSEVISSTSQPALFFEGDVQPDSSDVSEEHNQPSSSGIVESRTTEVSSTSSGALYIVK